LIQEQKEDCLTLQLLYPLHERNQLDQLLKKDKHVYTVKTVGTDKNIRSQKCLCLTDFKINKMS